MAIELVEYVTADGRSPFRKWFDQLDASVAARITVALTRIEHGNWSSVKGVGQGVLEYRIDAGPGYRVYFGRDGDLLVILLGGGTKRRQQRDIVMAQTAWRDYKRRARKRWH